MHKPWLTGLDDLRQMAIWVLENGEKQRGAWSSRVYALSCAGSTISLKISVDGPTMREDCCQLLINHEKWNGALGLRIPDRLMIDQGTITAFGDDAMLQHDSYVYRPFIYETISRLDEKRGTKKASVLTHQHDIIYFVYWYLLYGELPEVDIMSFNVDPETNDGKSLIETHIAHQIPYTFFVDSHDRFKTDFTMIKMMVSG